MNYYSVVTYIIAGTAFASILMSAAELSKKEKKAINYIASLLYLIYGMGLLVDRINYSDFFEHIPHFAYVNDILEMIGGVLFYFFLRSFIEKNVTIKKTEYIYFIPVVIVLFFYIPFFMSPAQVKIDNYPLINMGNIRFAVFYRFINRYVELWILFFVLLFIVRLVKLCRNKEVDLDFFKSSNVYVLFLYAFLWAVLTIVFVYDNLNPNMLRQRLIMASWSVLGCMLLIMKYRYGIYAERGSAEVNIKYRKSKVEPDKKVSILEELDRVMTADEFYKNMDITLEAVSRKLNITPHELSEIINSQLNITFKTYVNNFRINKAKVMLKVYPKMDILPLAFRCGFKSKTAFNTNFKKLTGMTPTEFRNESITED